MTQWYPVASAADVPFRHVFHGQLLGQELAVWRADDGNVNVWTNQCIHRGVRLSIGINDGKELRCQYHNWRYANRTGGCTYIPAHPGDAPSPTLCITAFPAVERYGLVWSSLDCSEGPPAVAVLEEGSPFGLRNVPFDAPASIVAGQLLGHTFQPIGHLDGADASMEAVALDEFAVELTSRVGAMTHTTAVLFVQPVDAGHCVVRGVLAKQPGADERLAVQKHHDDRLSALRERVEAESAGVAPVVLTTAPRSTPPARPPTVAVTVRRKWMAGEGIAGFELAPVEGVLPTVQPGAHIDVHVPNGLMRQYSLTNGPGEQHVYRIGVKREPDSRGGSGGMHDMVQEGDVLTVSAPYSNFPLRRDAERTVLLAGGIGITPLLAMAQALQNSGRDYELHAFAQSDAHLAFPEILKALGAAVRPHLALGPAETGAEIEWILGAFRPASQVYVCGPGPMLDAARAIAARLSWPDDAVHFEYFKNTTIFDDTTTFEVHLARSALTLTIPPGRSVLAILRERGIAVPSSCEQGACGTCLVAVLEGEPDHQDVYLRPSEHAQGDRMTVCVSRSKSARLVLDL